MTVVKDIVEDAVYELGILAPGDPLTPNISSHALRMLNRLVESLNIEGLLIYDEERNVYPLTVGTQTYELGPATDPQLDPPITLSTTRPVLISRLGVLLTENNPTNEIGVSLLSDEDWAGVSVKQTTGGFPTGVHITGDFPTRKVECWPIPGMVCSLVVYNMRVIPTFTDLTNVISLPQGYEDLLMYNLAIRLAPSYGIQASPTTIELARQAKTRLRDIFTPECPISSDDALVGRANTIAIRSFGILVDE